MRVAAEGSISGQVYFIVRSVCQVEERAACASIYPEVLTQ